MGKKLKHDINFFNGQNEWMNQELKSEYIKGDSNIIFAMQKIITNLLAEVSETNCSFQNFSNNLTRCLDWNSIFT